MKFKFRSLPLGFKILLIGIVLAFLSMLLPWRTEIIRVPGGRFHWAENPFRNGEFLILLPYLYHLGMMFTGRAMNRWIALVLVLVPVIGFFVLLPDFAPSVVYRLAFAIHYSIRPFNHLYDSEAGIGCSLFLVFSIIAVLGMLIGLKHTARGLSLTINQKGKGQ